MISILFFNQPTTNFTAKKKYCSRSKMPFFLVWINNMWLLMLLDLSAAFDTIDHNIFWISWCLALGLLAVLSNGFPFILTTEPNWEGVFQTVCHYHRGVSQGSCLGPLTLTTYASKLFEVLWGHLPDVHAYADDTQLYLSFKPNSDVNQHDTITPTELYVKAICNWILAEKLNLNDDNTELFW